MARKAAARPVPEPRNCRRVSPSARACCRAAYLRGTFLGGGSLSVSRAPHLELRTASRASAAFLCEIAAADGGSLAVAERSTHAVAYAKSWEAIESVLALMGAAETVLALEERAVVAETSARANRLANADHANLVRTSRSAQLQLDAVERLRAAARLEHLPHSLHEAAVLRARHPSDSLRELAARTDPPATKAAVHRRLRRLEELADRLR